MQEQPESNLKAGFDENDSCSNHTLLLVLQESSSPNDIIENDEFCQVSGLYHKRSDTCFVSEGHHRLAAALEIAKEQEIGPILKN